jgi:VWFA-related protein
MTRSLVGFFFLFALVSSFALAQTDSGVQEQVEVNLVLIDAVVFDGKGKTVGGLTREDFRLTVGGRAQEIDTFDVGCPDGPTDEPVEMMPIGKRQSLPAPAQMRRIVLALDYHHLPLDTRLEAIQQAKAMIAYNKTGGEQVMIVALADGLRIEQRFSSDPNLALATLDRMEHDKSLYAREFSGVSGRAFFDDMGVLMDVMSFIDGAKEVVLISGYHQTTTEADLWFQELAQRAGLGRAAIYAADIYGDSGPTGGSAALARISNESGGRSTYRTNDLTLAYARAQQAAACRYALGFYVEADEADKPRKVRVDVEGRGRDARAVEWFKSYSEEDRRESMLRAAFADPEAFENPLVRLSVYPLRPLNKNEWEAAAILQFPLHVGDRTVEIDVAATLARGGIVRKKFQSSFPVTGAAGLEGGDRNVTLTFQGDLKPDTYELTSLLSPRLDSEMVFSTSAEFSVPAVRDGVFVSGPFLARAVPGGLLLRGEKNEFKPIETDSRAARALGDDSSFEMLIVHRVKNTERLLSSWSVCTVDKKWKTPSGATVVRELVPRDEGGKGHTFNPVPLELPAKGKARCLNQIDSLGLSGIEPGRYQLRVSLEDGGGESLALGVAPLLVE